MKQSFLWPKALTLTYMHEKQNKSLLVSGVSRLIYKAGERSFGKGAKASKVQ